MGFRYLNGKRWSEVTREERFFCQRLYERIVAEPAAGFVSFLQTEHGLDVSSEGEWEAGFEVCFYRDLWQHRSREGSLFSPKRTFDLCLFGERAILIIEAKAAERFDPEQTKAFARDVEEVKRVTQVEHVALLGLCSSKCDVEPELSAMFTGPIVRWKDLASRYDDDLLLRADAVFEPRSAFAGAGRYSDERMRGAALMKAFESGADWWVGRGEGLNGRRFQDDVATGGWRAQLYEVNTTATSALSRNYFKLADFAAAVLGTGTTSLPSIEGGKR